MTAPIILEKVLRNMRKESRRTQVRTDDTPRLRGRTSQHVVDCVDVFRKSVHNTTDRLRNLVSGSRISANPTVRTVVSKKDIGLCMTRLMASFLDVSRKKDAGNENLRDVAYWTQSTQ